MPWTDCPSGRWQIDSADTRACTPNDLAQLYGVGVHKIIAYIKNGVLRAINLAAEGSSKPRWRILHHDRLAFENARAAIPPPKPVRQRKKKAEGVIEFF